MVNTKRIFLNENFEPIGDWQEPSYVEKIILSEVCRGYDYRALMENELLWLYRLEQFSWVPKVIKAHDKGFIMTYVGKPVTPQTLPFDWKIQMEQILADLASVSCFHNDIKNQELLVKDNKLYLIDFHHATKTREEFQELKRLKKCGCRMHWEDRSAMINILGNLEKTKNGK